MKMKKFLLLLCASTIGAYAQTLTVHCNDKGKYGYVDENGKEVVKCQYDLTEKFENGFGKILKGDKHGYVNEKGKVIIQPKYQHASLSANRFWLMDGKGNLEVVDEKGKKIVKLSKVTEVKPAQGNQNQFLVTTGNQQQVYNLNTKQCSPLYDAVMPLCQDPGSEVYAVCVVSNKESEWSLLNGVFKNPLPLQATAENAETILSVYQLWQFLSSPNFNYEEFVKDEKAEAVFQTMIGLVEKHGVTGNLKQSLPTFVWNINSIKK